MRTMPATRGSSDTTSSSVIMRPMSHLTCTQCMVLSKCTDASRGTARCRRSALNLAMNWSTVTSARKQPMGLPLTLTA